MPAPQDTTSPVDTPQVTAPVGHNGIRVDIEERPAWRVDGILAAVLTILALGDAIALARNAYFSDHDNFTPLALLFAAARIPPRRHRRHHLGQPRWRPSPSGWRRRL